MNRDHARRVLFNQLKRTVPIEAVLARYGIELKRQGNSLKGRCPVHGGSNPRQFVVSNNLWRCFSPSCDRGGGVLELVAELEKVDVKDAALLVAEWFCIKPSSDVQHRKPKERAMSSTKPTHKVFAVRDGNPDDPESKAWYTRIGSAWPIKSGKGLSIQLDALPVNDRIVLFEFENAEEAAEDDKKQAARRPTRK